MQIQPFFFFQSNAKRVGLPPNLTGLVCRWCVQVMVYTIKINFLHLIHLLHLYFVIIKSDFIIYCTIYRIIKSLSVCCCHSNVATEFPSSLSKLSSIHFHIAHILHVIQFRWKTKKNKQ
jgi:hypothetical protein